MYLRRRHWRLFSADTGQGGGGASGSGSTESGGTPATGGAGGTTGGASRQLSDDRIAEGLQRLADRYGDGLSMVLYRDNYQLREELRTVRSQLPAEGGVVLSREDAERWRAYQALGAPNELQTAVEARTTAEAKLKELERDGTLRDVAAAMKWRFRVLKDRDSAAGELTYTIVVADDGTKTITVKDAGGTESSLADYAKKHWEDYLPALQEAEAATSGGGTSFPRQAPAGSRPAGTDPAQRYLDRAYRPRRQE
jgi:hypothetical protein